MRSRVLAIALAAAGVLAFLVISAAVARVLGAANAERDAAISMVQALSHGDQAGAIAAIDGCRGDAACRRQVAAAAQRLHSPRKVRILRLDGVGGPWPSARTATARIAWRAGDALPVVQCVRLRRSGSLVAGFEVRVLGVSLPVDRQAPCPNGASRLALSSGAAG